MAKPPMAYRDPARPTKLMELLSWGNSVITSHLGIIENRVNVKPEEMSNVFTEQLYKILI